MQASGYCGKKIIKLNKVATIKDFLISGLLGSANEAL
jgi:hypothetical protein